MNVNETPEVLPRPLRRSVWTPRQKLIRLAWGTVGRVLWVLLPGARASILRRFGGTVGRNCKFARSVAIAIPWNVKIGDNVEVGQHAILYSLGVITIGDSVIIDDFAHLCAGTHDMTDSRFPLLTPPITIGAGSFIGIDAYIGPNVTLGERCKVWPRSSVHSSAPSGTELCGNPAKSKHAAATAGGTGAGASSADASS
jgi:putative colanic acid biosynthesis acetyltransferase WcaF